MSLATIDTARTSLRSAPAAPVLRAAAPLAPAVRRSHPASITSPTPTPVVAPVAAPARPARLRAVPEGTEARGFAIYVGLDELKAAAAGTDLGTVVAALKRLAAELAPGAETHAAVALAPRAPAVATSTWCASRSRTPPPSPSTASSPRTRTAWTAA
ncbi:hypothetical protein CMsap09_02620 [Clavibacter michiganensis]|uniref:Uncharacterized protein n=1 Tax=Clavibacter michiganensis TaxID=28447 RepID=A0A251XQL8_9MICO|nr:hypothetical protein CMsap09_02620 [Clavibacter michiganensis]